MNILNRAFKTQDTSSTLLNGSTKKHTFKWPSVETFLQAYPLSTALFLTETNRFVFANQRFLQDSLMCTNNCTDLHTFLRCLIKDDAQWIQSLNMIEHLQNNGEFQWCPVVIHQGINTVFAALQAWKTVIAKQDFIIIHLLLQPDIENNNHISFAPESNLPVLPSSNEFTYFSSAVHAAYNLWLLLDRLPCGVLLIDNLQRIVGVNQIIKDHYGYASTDFITIDNWWKHTHPLSNHDDVTASLAAHRKAFGPLQSTIMCQDGTKRSVLVELVSIAGDWSTIIYENIFPHVSDESNLLKIKNELYAKTEKLHELQITMRTLLEMRNADKKEIEDSQRIHMNNMVLPYLDKLHRLCTSDIQRQLVEMIRSNIDSANVQTRSNITHEDSLFTPRELQIAHMLIQDMNSKDIAMCLCIAKSSVGYYRNSLRKKLGIIDKKVNLKSALYQHLVSKK